MGFNQTNKNAGEVVDSPEPSALEASIRIVLNQLVKQAIEQEREACAKVADSNPEGCQECAGELIAKMIRERA